MIRDLRTILEGWDYEPGKISVRKIIGRGGHEKVQTRIDMGVLQIGLDGRPDGKRPHEHEALLDFHEHQLARHIDLYGDDQDFVLTPEECQELRHEAYMFYQRYLSLFVLEDFERVVRDTARNLRVIDFCEKYAAAREDGRALAAQRPYVLMMNARARAFQALQADDADEALAAVEAGIRYVRTLTEAEVDEESGDSFGQLRILAELREEIIAKLPPNAPVRLQCELQAALAREDYETAAALRDALGDRRASANID